MSPEIWGKSAWEFIHFITLAYPENATSFQKQTYKKYFDMLVHVLPCDQCKKNLFQHLKELPLTNEILSSKSKMVKWGIDLHNAVNSRNGKNKISYNEAIKNFDKLMNKNQKNYIWIILIIIIIIIGAIVYKKMIM